MNYSRLFCMCALIVSLIPGASSAAEPSVDPATVVLSFAVLGDAEPKPEPQFPNVDAAVRHVNALSEVRHLDFVLGVGDIAHKGTRVQYDNVTPILQALTLPFYPIMGNEEHGSTVERFLDYANRWNRDKAEIESPRYVLDTQALALVMASPDHGRDFDDQGIAWIVAQIQRLKPKPVLLVVHGAQTGIYPENPDKGITHPGFSEVVAQTNLAAVISGDLHMDMDRVVHSRERDGVHYLHIPALERTKIPDETRHTPMFRVFTVTLDNRVTVETFQVGLEKPLERHRYAFSLSR